MTNESKQLTFLKKPWISKEADGAEVRILSAYASVDTITPSSKGNSYQVKFLTDNNKHGLSGWVPKGNPLLEKIEKAKETNEPIHVRVEIRRKKDVDRTIPISELLPWGDMRAALTNTDKSIAAVRFEDEDSWLVSDKAVTRIEDDPKDSSLQSAYGKVTEVPVHSANPTPEYTQHGFVESTPFYDYNKDGSINYGSLSVSVPVNIYMYLNELSKSTDLNLTEERVKSLSKILLSVANEAQIKMYDGKISKPMLNSGSHTRARALVFEIVRNIHPISDTIAHTNDAKEFKKEVLEWRESLVTKTLDLWNWSVAESEKFLD